MSAGSWTMVHNAIVDDERVPRTAGWVYTVLARSARHGVIAVTYPELAARARLSRRTAISAVKLLVERGYVEVRSSRTGNEYTLPALVAAGASSAHRDGTRSASATDAPRRATGARTESADRAMGAPDSANGAWGSASAAPGSAKRDGQIALRQGPELHDLESAIALPIRSKDYRETNKDEIDERERSLASPISDLYRQLTGRGVPPSLALTLEKIAAAQGLEVALDMMRESYEATGSITAQTLAVSERKLDRAGQQRAGPAADQWTEPPDPRETHPLWRAVLLALRDEVAPSVYVEWCLQTRALGVEGDQLRVAARATFHANVLARTLGPRAETVLRRLGQDTISVHFVVQEEAFRVSAIPP